MVYTGAVTWDVVVVGGGPAGLVAAIAAAERGARALVLERMPAPGGKLLVSGGGRGNVTHGGEIAEFLVHYHGGGRPGAAGRFLRPALQAFTNRDLMAYCAQRGVPLEEGPDGRVFPISRRAGDVVDLLLGEVRRRRVELCTEARVRAVRPDRGGFTVSTERGAVSGRTVVLATGGRSYPSLGSSGDGYRLAASLGHRIVPLGPGLVPVVVARTAFAPFAGCAGVAVRGTEVALVRGGKVLSRRQGDVLFTHRGLSGPAILDLSRTVVPGDVLRVALAPGVGDVAAAQRRLAEEITAHGRRTVANLLVGLGVTPCLARAIVEAAGMPIGTKAAAVPRAGRRALAASLAAGDGGHPFPVASVGGWTEAMVTRGGVALDEVDPRTMESRLVAGLFFAGEVLDVDGDTGGYNLQAAFSSGRLAGSSAAHRAPSPAGGTPRIGRQHGRRMGKVSPCPRHHPRTQTAGKLPTPTVQVGGKPAHGRRSGSNARRARSGKGREHPPAPPTKPRPGTRSRPKH